MVTVTGFKTVQLEDGQSYVNLILSGDLEMVQSTETGNFYATTRRASMSCTFDEATAALMVGKQLDGSITKIDVEPYDYLLDSGEKVEMTHRWVYVPLESKVVNLDSQAA